MGGGASTHNHIAHKLMPPMEEEAQKPADASDLPDDAEILKKEVIALRGKLRHAVDHGRQHLDTENQKAMQEAVNGLMKNAVEVEKSITPFLKDVVKKCGGELTGLNHRFKTRDSLERKVMGDIEAMKRRNARSKSEASSLVDVVGVVNSMGDSLRYTMLVPASEYCAVVISTRKILEEMGNPGIKFKNYWEKGDMYQGINDNYKNATTNFVFELQYHTPESWALKKDSHVIYEKFRVCQNPADLQKLFQEGVDLAASLPIPEGVESIPTLLKNPEPNLLSAYAYVISQNVHGVGDKLQNWFKEKVGESASIKVDADDEPTIEAELRMLIDQANEAIEDIVLSHYFFGLAVHVTIDEKHYAEVVDKLLGEMKAPKDGESIRVVSEKVMNSWEDNTNTKCIRVYAVAGSRATKFPQDNILFEVIFYTPKAQEVESKVATMLRQNKSSKNQEELNKAIEELWISCPLPDNFAAMKHLPTPHPPASPRAT